ncbi:hypothetical protein [Nostoc sp.]|uniref:hypothetical protein n=1 Tax=Nostoc sp. TaxID=1180 RepID=UPI002FF74277
MQYPFPGCVSLALKVVDTLPKELRGKITKPSQTPSLLRLVKTPDKLQQAVAIALNWWHIKALVPTPSAKQSLPLFLCRW